VFDIVGATRLRVALAFDEAMVATKARIDSCGAGLA